MSFVEVSLSPALFSLVPKRDYAVVVIDVLRATSAICAAFNAGADGIIPVADLEKALQLKQYGFVLAAERDGLKVADADFGNSPMVFLKEDLEGKIIVYSTTNGTAAIEDAKVYSPLVLGSFNNFSRVVGFLESGNKDVLLYCSGWKNAIGIEDVLLAGAIADQLVISGNYTSASDSSNAAIALWQEARGNLAETVLASDHGKRLLALGLEEDIQYCLKNDTSNALPWWNGEMIVNAKG